MQFWHCVMEKKLAENQDKWYRDCFLKMKRFEEKMLEHRDQLLARLKLKHLVPVVKDYLGHYRDFVACSKVNLVCHEKNMWQTKLLSPNPSFSMGERTLRTHTHTHTHAHTHDFFLLINIYTHTYHTCLYTYICLHICLSYIYIYIYIYIYEDH